MQLDQTNYVHTDKPKNSFDVHSAGGIVINNKGQIALVEQGGVSWSFPKGHLEPNETPLEAAVREIGEETGIQDLRLVGELESYIRTSDSYSPDGINTVNKKITLFIFQTVEEELRSDINLITNIRWVSKDNVVDALSHPRDKEFYTECIIWHLNN